MPQSIAVSTRGTLTLPLSSTATDGRDIADEAAVHGDAEPVAFGHAASPAALLVAQSVRRHGISERSSGVH